MSFSDSVLVDVHWLAVIEPQPALDDTVNNPYAVSYKYKPAYNEHHHDCPQHPPKHSEPERPDLPTKMTLQECSGHVILLDIVHHDCNYGGDADKIRRSIQCVNDCGKRFCRFFVSCGCYVFH